MQKKESLNYEDKTPKNVNYHPGFVSGLKVLLWDYREQIDIYTERWLNIGGIRIDVLVIKTDPGVDIIYDISRIWKGHNIVEYKRSDDELSIDVFAKVMAYVNLYKSKGIFVDAISYNDISATIYRHAYPREAFRKLKEHGAMIEQAYPGVYYVKRMSPFPIQILVGRQLDPKEYAMFRVLMPGASDEDIRNFKNIALQNTDAVFQESVDSIFQVSISVNRESYARLLKEDPEMCEAMRDLMRDVMKEDFEKAEARGEVRGEIKGVVKLYRDEMHLSPPDIIKKIMIRFNLKKSEAEKYVEEMLLE